MSSLEQMMRWNNENSNPIKENKTENDKNSITIQNAQNNPDFWLKMSEDKNSLSEKYKDLKNWVREETKSNLGDLRNLINNWNNTYIWWNINNIWNWNVNVWWKQINIDNHNSSDDWLDSFERLKSRWC